MANGSAGGTAKVSWMAGMGGPAATGFAIQAFDSKWGYAGAAFACGTCRNGVVSGLINGRIYTFFVYALNGAGASNPAQSLPTLMPSTVASAPQDVRVEGRDGGLRVGWVPPVNEGAALTGYAIAAIDDDGAIIATAGACGACTSGTIGGLTNGTPYRIAVAAQNNRGTGAASSVVTGTPTPVPPSATDASAASLPGGFTATWSHDAGDAAPPDFYVVQAFGSDSFSQWFACGTCHSLTMGPLPQARTYDLKIYPHNSAGYGEAATVSVTTGSGDCTDIALCAEVDAGGSRGPARQRAQGLLNGYTAATNTTLLDGLHIKQWRVSRWSEAAAKAQTMPDTSLTVLISDAWRSAATSGGKVQAPWANWFRYTTFVKQFVQQYIAEGHRVDYWEIQNEPLPTEYSSGPVATTELWWELYRVGYNTIKSVDPDAKIVAPTVPQLLWTNTNRNAPNAIDLPGFMTYADTHDLHFDAYSWHELGISQPGYYDSPQRVLDDVQAARTALAMHPALGSPKFFANEYMPAANYLVPGHLAGFITAFEDADVDQANTTCHEYTSGPAPHDCGTGTLDGALTPDQVTPRGTYWVRQQYANMTGDRLATSTSHPAVSVFATTPTDGTYKVMVSRHQSCVRAVNVYCTQGTTATPPPATLTLKLRTGDTSTPSVDVRMVPVGVDAQPSLVDVTTFSSSTTDGVTTVQLPAVADGDVYILTITFS